MGKQIFCLCSNSVYKEVSSIRLFKPKWTREAYKLLVPTAPIKKFEK